MKRRESKLERASKIHPIGVLKSWIKVYEFRFSRKQIYSGR